MEVLKYSFLFILCIFSLLPYIDAENEENKEPAKLKDLKIEVVKGPMGECMRKSKVRDMVHLQYTGYFENGTKFDSSLDRPGRPPITFQLGTGQVIPGWERGLLDMCIGERRKLFIPSHLAYGKTGAGVIPPDTDLIFETEIVRLIDGPPPMNVFKMIDVDGDQYITVEEAALYLSHQAIAQRVPNNIAIQQNKAQLQQLFGTDDKDRDGRVSYDEFSGPKVDPPMHDEL